MGFLAKFFGRAASSRESWPVITTQIARDFEAFRSEWFRACVMILERGGIQVMQLKMTPESEDSMKAFQLLLTSGFLADHGYVAAADGRDFSTLLFAQVSGTRSDQVAECWQRYEEAIGGQFGGQLIFRFALDLSQMITGSAGNLGPAMLAEPIGRQFVVWTHLVVARAFGDEAMARRLQEQVGAST